MAKRRLKFWGWGFEDEVPTEEEERVALARIAERAGVGGLDRVSPPRLDEISLPAPRLRVPSSLARILSADKYERASHSYGKSYPDYVRAFRRDFSHPPDLVAYPESERDIVDLLEWAEAKGAAVIPFGHGSSVVGGIEPAVGEGFGGTVTVDLRRMDRVLEVDGASRAARIQAGAGGPVLEQQLRPQGHTLRHFPQSFEFSTLGGWIATRSSGHFATLHTHIDDFVESLRLITPRGIVETRRLPGSGAGPSPDRLFIGSEGALGIITEAWMRVQERPVHRASAVVRFADFDRAAEAVRAVAQAGLYPANCRLIDSEEAALAGAGEGTFHLLLLAFESADHPVETWMKRALECVRDQGGRCEAEAARAGGDTEEDPAAAWRGAFLRAPYLREALIARGLMHDTFESAVTWDRFADFHAKVIAATRDAIREVTGHRGHVTCRLTHCYPDGAAPYFTLHALAARGGEIEQWKEIKSAASETLIGNGGTITHHHAVGRDHMPWYRRQRPPLFAEALKAVKKTLDPNGSLNPGVLVEPLR